MNQQRLWLCIGVAALLLAGGAYAQGKSLAIGEVEGSNVTVPVTMTSDEPIEGFVLSVAYDTTKLATLDVRAVGAAAAAELIVSEIVPEGFTLGVVMDFVSPYDGQTIPAGTEAIAEADLEADVAALGLELGGPPAVLPLELVDGLNEPPLANIVVAGGMSFGVNEGLALVNGAVTVVPKGDDIRIVSAIGADNDTSVPVSITVDNTKPVEGFVLSIAHDSAIALADIALGAAAASAEFFVPRIYANGGTLGVVMDFEPPYDGQTVPVGTGNELAVFTYTRPCDGVYDSFEFNLEFADGVFGNPLLSNTLVEDGMSVPPNPTNGTVTFVCAQTVQGLAVYVQDNCGVASFDDGYDLSVYLRGDCLGEAAADGHQIAARQPLQ